MRVQELEKCSGISRHALRYYEREGLLGGILRSPNGYRDYPPETLTRLRLLKHMQTLGFELDAIRQVFEAMDAQDINCADGALLLADQRAKINAKIRRLQAANRALAREQKKLEERAAHHGVTARKAQLD